MPAEVTCSGCQQQFPVPDDFHGPWLTCPRCQARLVNPAALVLGDGDGPESPQHTPETPNCPRCGSPLVQGWESCPNCALTTHPEATRFQDESAEDIHSARRMLWGWLVAALSVSVLGLLGSAVAIRWGNLDLAILGVLASIGLSGVLWITISIPAKEYYLAKGVARDLATSAGIGLGFLCTFVAWIVLFFVACG